MDEQTDSPDMSKVSEEAREIWRNLAGWWDDRYGEGNRFHRVLLAPTAERLLDVRSGDIVLDIACGNGAFSRRLADLGARVVGFDVSETFIARAQQKSAAYSGRIEFRVIDATAGDQLLQLGAQQFDAAVCHMALMDIADLRPLASALGRLLKPAGRFVFSVSHPCFSSSWTQKVVEEAEGPSGDVNTSYAVKVTRYIRPTAKKGTGIIGQPMPHYTFHRPISLLLSIFFAEGFVLDGLEEPVYSQGTQADRPFSWANFEDIPPALVARLRSVSP